MSNTHIYSKYSKFGYQILFKVNGKREFVKVGATPGDQFQIAINLSIAPDFNHQDTDPINRYKFSTKQIVKNGKPLDAEEIADNTVIIQFSKNLWSLFSLQKRIDLNQSLLYQFEEDLLKQKDPKSGILPNKCHALLHQIIKMIASDSIGHTQLSRSIYKFSQAFIDGIKQATPNVENTSLIAKIKVLMQYIIANEFSYPDNKNFKILTGVPKTTFQKQFKAISRKPLTYFIDELKFKSGITEIILADNQISDIAQNLGYSELSPFTRFIKRRTGIPPTEIRHIAKGDICNLLLE